MQKASRLAWHTWSCGWLREGGGSETASVEWWPLSCCGLSEEMHFTLATAANRARGRRQVWACIGSGRSGLQRPARPGGRAGGGGWTTASVGNRSAGGIRGMWPARGVGERLGIWGGIRLLTGGPHAVERGKYVADTCADRVQIGTGRQEMWAGLRVWPSKE
jgi:hypothetical protein